MFIKFDTIFDIITYTKPPTDRSGVLCYIKNIWKYNTIYAFQNTGVSRFAITPLNEQQKYNAR